MSTRWSARISPLLILLVLLLYGALSALIEMRSEALSKTARYVRLVARSEVNGGPWASAADLHRICRAWKLWPVRRIRYCE
jgi:hypothetical protein